MALGKLGWSEYQYYTCSPEGFYYACKGYFSKLEDQSIAIRNCTAVLFAVMGGKENIDKLWPLRGVKVEEETLVVDAELLATIKRVHKLKK